MRRGSYPERSVRSLQNPSGMSDADKTTHAAANFAGADFAYMHCWEIMKDEPKWQDPKTGASAKSAAGEGFGEDAINLGDDNSSPAPAAAAVTRPMGRDAAKAAKKRANTSPGSTSSSEYAASMKELSLQKISIFQEEVGRKNDCFQQLACIDEKRFEEM